MRFRAIDDWLARAYNRGNWFIVDVLVWLFIVLVAGRVIGLASVLGWPAVHEMAGG